MSLQKMGCFFEMMNQAETTEKPIKIVQFKDYKNVIPCECLFEMGLFSEY